MEQKQSSDPVAAGPEAITNYLINSNISDDMPKLQGDSREHKYFAGVRTEYDDDGMPRISAPAETHYVRSYKQRDAWLQQKIRHSRRKHAFTFSNMDTIRQIIAHVPDNHCGYLLYLQCFVGYNGTLQNPDKSPMTKGDIMKTLRIKKDAMSEFLKCMTMNHIILSDVVDGEARFRIDSRYHWRGGTSNTHVVKSFTSKVKELYKEVNAKDLGFMYKLLPHIHFETNTICSNPYESNPDKIVALNKSEIARITGVTEKSVYTKIRNLKFGDERVFAEIVRGNQRFYMVNPFVFYRKSDMPDPTLRAIFRIHVHTV